MNCSKPVPACHTSIVPEFCTCGAQLPPDARFCHKCGKPQGELFSPGLEVAAEPVVPVVAPPPPPPEIGFANGTAVRIGFLAALISVLLLIIPLPFPLLRIVIVFVAAGFLAVYLYMRRTGQRLTLRGGARMGWMTGIFSFTIFTVQLTASVLASSSEGGFAGVLKQNLPPNDAHTSQLLQLIEDPSALVFLMLMVLAFLFVFLTILPTLGGLLGAKLLAREN
jgi:hypothetical protein